MQPFGPTATRAVSYAALVTLGLLALACGVTYLDRTSIGNSLVKFVPFLQVNDIYTARVLLASLLKGLFASVFPMAVVLFLATSSNKQSGNPGVTSRGVSYVVPGFITGTITFLIVVLSNLKTLSQHEVPVLSVAVGTLLSIASLIAFLHFTYEYFMKR